MQNQRRLRRASHFFLRTPASSLQPQRTPLVILRDLSTLKVSCCSPNICIGMKKRDVVAPNAYYMLIYAKKSKQKDLLAGRKGTSLPNDRAILVQNPGNGQ